ncbi:hypothetical protein GE21DRAFT_1310855 [Neurospora crassa]|nr:hypothetical protein GE21DRAFT_1310855 [Neurospora crassa]
MGWGVLTCLLAYLYLPSRLDHHDPSRTLSKAARPPKHTSNRPLRNEVTTSMILLTSHHRNMNRLRDYNERNPSQPHTRTRIGSVMSQPHEKKGQGGFGKQDIHGNQLDVEVPNMFLIGCLKDTSSQCHTDISRSF